MKNKDFEEYKKKAERIINEVESKDAVIVATKKEVAIRGSEAEITNAITLMVKGLLDNGFNKKLLKESLELAFLSEKELLEKFEDVLKELKEKLN